MTLRIHTTRHGARAVVRLVGRIRGENLGDLQHEIAGGPDALDLHEVTIVDVEVVRFLKNAESSGIELRDCPPFIREWINREREGDS